MSLATSDQPSKSRGLVLSGWCFTLLLWLFPLAQGRVGCRGAGRRGALWTRSSTTYYALRHAASAPPGLPPVVLVNWVTAKDSHVGPWVCFFLTPPPTSSVTEPLCVLRVAHSDLDEYSEHKSPREALHRLCAHAPTTHSGLYAEPSFGRAETRRREVPGGPSPTLVRLPSSDNCWPRPSRLPIRHRRRPPAGARARAVLAMRVFTRKLSAGRREEHWTVTSTSECSDRTSLR
jgi:hypothetical protein